MTRSKIALGETAEAEKDIIVGKNESRLPCRGEKSDPIASYVGREVELASFVEISQLFAAFEIDGVLSPAGGQTRRTRE